MRKTKRAISTTAAAMAAFALLAACGGSGDDDDGDGDAKKPAGPRPIISEKEARGVLDTYSKTNNKANETRDGDVLSQVEGGALFRQSSAQYEQFRTYDKEYRKQYGEPFHYLSSKAEFFIPSSGDWYMAHAPVQGPGFKKDDHSLLVFERTGGGTWKMTASLGVVGELPEPELDKDGFPAVLPEDARVGGTALDDLDDAVSDLYVSGGKKAGAVFAEGKVRKNMVKDYRTRGDWVRPEHKGIFKTEFETVNGKWEDEYKPEYPEGFALRTADGGALVAFNSYNSRVDFAVRPGFHIIPGDTTKLYVKEKEPLGVREYYSVQNLVHVPAEGKAEQLAGEVQMLGAS